MRSGPQHYLPHWINASHTSSGHLSTLLEWVGEEGEYLQQDFSPFERSLYLGTIPLGLDRHRWTVPYYASRTEELLVRFQTSVLSGLVQEARTDWEFTTATLPTWRYVEAEALLHFRNLHYREQTLSSATTTYTLTGEVEGRVRDSDLWWRESGDRRWRRLSSENPDVSGTSFVLPSSGTKTVRYGSQQVLNALSSGTVTVDRYGGGSRLLSLQQLWPKNLLDDWGALFGLPRFENEDNQSYRDRLVTGVLVGDQTTEPGLLRGLANQLGLVQRVDWDGISTLTLDSSGVSGITNLWVRELPRYRKVEEDLFPAPGSTTQFWSTYHTWSPGWLVLVDGVPTLGASVASGQVTLTEGTTGRVSAEYSLEHYSFSLNPSGSLAAVLPGCGVTSGSYQVIVSRSIDVHSLDNPDFRETELYTAEGLATLLLLDLSRELREGNPSALSRGRWGAEAVWLGAEEQGPGIQYLPARFDYPSESVS